VTVAPHSAASAAGIPGVILTVGRVDELGAAARLHVSVNYSSFAYAYGGNYASRLHLVELPACALTTPRVASCRTQTPLASADDVKAASVGADVSLPAAQAASAAGTGAGRARPAAAPPPAAAGQGSVVLAATPAPSGSGGDFTATPLSEAGSWSAGGQSGAFDYAYPVSVPPVPGGLEPDVSLGYNSQAVDGLTSSTNSQASWIGDGWDYSPGYVERDYQSCEQNPAGSTKTGDFCWSANDTTTLSLNGQDTTLVKDGSTGAWHPEADNGEKVSYQTAGPATSNGTCDNGYWVITQTDGTKYYFGLNELPGYAAGDAATGSSWNMPVYGIPSGQPCYKSSTFASSSAYEAWRWNLDYVTDPHGDAVAYFYSQETNYYASDNGTKATAAYQQAGALSKIEYGLRAGAVYGVTPAAQVTFTTGTSRTDVPTDLTCASGAACSVVSPTFWGRYQLTSITTQALKGSSLENADSWALSQTYPSTGDITTPPSLWLSAITRTGQDGTAVSLPSVSFLGAAMPNRVETSAELSDGYSIITRIRLTSITNETGGVTSIGYATPGGACTTGNFPAPDANTLSCYPDYWTPGATCPDPTKTPPCLDWFNKYAVSSVTQHDTTGAGLPVVTGYQYSGAAWHYNDDSLTRSKNRTWDQWRGFRQVTTQNGASPDPVTRSVRTYFQGMNGDYQSGGGTSSVSLTSSQDGSDVVADSGQYAGLEFEHAVYNGSNGSLVSDTVTLPWTSAATATQSQPSPLPALRSYLTGTTKTKVYTALASGGNRESDTAYAHDSYGRVISASDVPDTSDASQDTCTTTAYADNASTWILNLPAEVKVVSVPCGTTPSLPADAVSDKLTFYDGATSLSADTPSAGNVTQTQLATSYSGSAPVYTPESKAAYDEYGRVLTSTDADSRTTTTSYVPATGAEPASKTVTDPAGLVTTTTYDPARDLPLTVTDPAGLTTTEQYDGLGRLTAAWTPGNATTGPANDTFSYTPSHTVPSVVTSRTLAPDGSAYLASETLYDALGRTRETQHQTPDGGWDITDTVYNSDGNQTLTSGPYYATGITPGTLVAAPEAEVASQQGKVYDGDGRVVRDVAYSQGKETWETDTSYGGDYTTAVPVCTAAVPVCGGTARTTLTDGRGLTTQIDQYHAGVPDVPSDPAADFDKTSYTYAPSKKLAAITDSSGNKWSYTYNLAGDQTSQSDPDAGTLSSAYDAAGRLVSTTDARGKQVSYVYDADGRKIAEYDTTAGAAESPADEIASWTYDTLARGKLTSSSSYYGGQAYTDAVTGYNAFGEPKGGYTVIPSAQGNLAGTYLTEYTSYTPAGQLAAYEDSAAGGLPAETVSYGYDAAGQPTSATGIWAYAYSLSYTELGQPLEYKMGSGSEPAYVLDSYDPQTQLPSEQQTETGITPVTVDDTHYAYDNAGNVTSEADTPSGGPAQVQCFTYDYLGRLTQAWSQGSSGCASAPSTSAEGGAAPYWSSYTYNAIGNLTSQTSTSQSGQATTTTDNYPAAGAAQPHAPSSQQVSGSSGTTTTAYLYDASGQLSSASGTSQSRSLSWDDAGRLASIATTPAGSATPSTTSYLYDADGTLLLQKDPGQTTLYLPDEQLVLNTTTGAVSGTRYYTIGGQAIAARTSTGSVDYLIGDREGTSGLSIDSGTLATTRRYYDPYGNAIGAAPSSWPGDKGFVGGTADTATSLTNLGAREYSPASGQFISPDPLLAPMDPQNLNPYAYAADNPSTHSDPSGAVCIPGFCDPFPYGGPPPPGHGGGGGGGRGGGGGGGNGGGGGPPTTNLSPPLISATGQVIRGTGSPYITPKPVVRKTTNGSPASEATCNSGVSLRVAGPPSGGCRPARLSGGGGFSLGGFIKFINRAAPIITAVAIATSFIPGVDAATGALAFAVDAISVASAGADLATAATSSYAIAEDIRHGKGAGQTAVDAGGLVLSLVGAGAAAKVYQAERAAQSAEEGARAAAARLDGAISSASRHFSGPLPSRMRAFSAMQNATGYTGALAAVHATTVDLGAAEAAYDFVSGTSLAYTEAFSNPY